MSARTPGHRLEYVDRKPDKRTGDVLLLIRVEDDVPAHSFYVHKDYAPFIVEACNGHDSLVAQRDALRSALAQMVRLGESLDLDELHGDCFEVARAALLESE